jgi:hypothetical protein
MQIVGPDLEGSRSKEAPTVVPLAWNLVMVPTAALEQPSLLELLGPLQEEAAAVVAVD